MINTELYISLNNTKWENVLPNYKQTAEDVVSLTVNFIAQKEPSSCLTLNKPLSFNLCLSDDTEIHALNKEFRGKDKPTNVLSFANIDSSDFEQQIKFDDIIEMGDIIIALETMQKESAEKNISLNDHFCHLLTHGVLHLLGYDHIEDEEAEHMENFEINILKQMNIKNPYEE